MSDTEQRCWGADGEPVAFVDQITERGYCRGCASNDITSSFNVHLQFLDSLLPFGVGDRVECRTVGEYYDGNGEVVRVSEELHDGGTPVFPAYLVKMDDPEKWPEDRWYTGICLTRVHERAH